MDQSFDALYSSLFEPKTQLNPLKEKIPTKKELDRIYLNKDYMEEIDFGEKYKLWD